MNKFDLQTARNKINRLYDFVDVHAVGKVKEYLISYLKTLINGNVANIDTKYETVVVNQIIIDVQAMVNENPATFTKNDEALRVFKIGMLGYRNQPSAQYVTHGKSILEYIKDHQQPKEEYEY